MHQFRPVETEAGSASDSGPSASQAIVELMYRQFNTGNLNGTVGCFTEDCLYEDLLFGSSAVVKTREAFRELLPEHPVFMMRTLAETMKFQPPKIAILADAMSEDPNNLKIIVEWHVEVNGQPLEAGRGISVMTICPRTGLIKRAVDIAEAPWRIVGAVMVHCIRGVHLALLLLAFPEQCAAFLFQIFPEQGGFAGFDDAALADSRLDLAIVPGVVWEIVRRMFQI